MINKNDLVVLISEKISDRVLLLNKLWKGAGHTTCLIYCSESVTFNSPPDADMVIKADNPGEAVAICVKIDKKIIHYFNYGADAIGQLLLVAKQNYIYDYKDLFYRVRSTPLRPGISEVEMAIVKNADFITNRDDQIHNYLKINKINFDPRKLFYVPEFFNTDFEYEKSLAISKSIPKNSINLVMTGGFDRGDESSCEILYEGVDRVLNLFIKNDISITIIGNYSNVNSLEASIHTKNFDRKINVIKSLDSHSFDRELLKFDFAIHLINNDVSVPNYSLNYSNSEHLGYCGSARLYSYVKAGLPILIGKSMEFNKKVFYDSGYLIDIDSLIDSDVKDILVQLKLNGYIKKLISSRDRFGYEAALLNFTNKLYSKL
jgi:hypothetical protein